MTNKKKYFRNKLHSRLNVATVLMLAAALLLVALLPGCGDTTPADLTGCTIEVKSVGGKALQGVGMYIYKDAAMTDMIDYVKTDANGIATISHPVPVGSIIVPDKVPEGYVTQESYPITTAQTKIALQTQLREQFGKITLGDVMFDFTVTDIDGNSHKLSDLLETKRAVVLNLWYVNCNPCKAEFPYLNMAYSNYSDVIEVLALNPEGDNEDAIREFASDYALPFPAVKADEAWKNTIGGLAYPATIIIDRFGAVGLIHIGGIESSQTFENAFAYFTSDNYVQSTVKDIEDIPDAITAPLGSQENPQEFMGTASIEVTVQPGADYYCNIYRVGGMELKATSQTLKVSCGDAVAQSVDGVVTMQMPSTTNPSVPFAVCLSNTGTQEETYTITFSYPLGSRENPLALKLEQMNVEVAAGNAQGVYLTYTAQKKGTLILNGLKKDSGYNVLVYNVTSGVQNTLEEDATVQSGKTVLSIATEANDEIQILVCSNADNAGNYPAAFVTFTAKFEAKESSGSTNTGTTKPNTNGTLVNPDAPEEQYGFVDFTVEVGAGEKKLVYLIRTVNEATFVISDKNAYVVYNGTTYTPQNGKISIAMKSEGSFEPIVLEIGNSGTSKKTFSVQFLFAEGTRENPIALKTGDNTINCAAGNNQGTFYSFEAKSAGTLTLQIKSINPATVVLGINISDMMPIPATVELLEGETSISIELPEGAVAQIIFSAKDPNKDWKIPEAQAVITVSFS